MSALGLGTWKSKPGEVYEAVKEAIRQGYRHIDCAYIYGNEAEIGKALQESFAEGVTTREEMWITSKLWNNSHAPEDVLPAIQKTLADLQLEALDLYLVHWPVAFPKEISYPRSTDQILSLEDRPIADTWKEMETLVDKGLCKHIGVSNFSVKKIKELLETARIKPEMNQVELHPYLQQNALVSFCQENGIHLTAYSPLGSPDRPEGLKAEDDPILLQDPTIAEIAERSNGTSAQVLIAWSIHRDTSVIPKSTNPVRIKQNLEASDVQISQEDMQVISTLDRHRRYVDGRFWTMEGSPYTQANLWDD